LFEWGVNFKNRIIEISEEIDDFTFSKVDAAITEMEAESKKTITIRINSQGGSVYDALAIVGRMRKSHCYIVTEGYGCIMSAATMILAAGTKRKVSELCWFMHHESTADADLGSMRTAQLEAYAKQMRREEEQWARWMSEFTDKPKEFWLDKGTHIDAYFEAPELIEMGVADEIF